MRRIVMRVHHLVSAVGVLMVVGCSSADPEAIAPPGGDDDGLLQPPPAGQGLQLKMVSTIAPGQEIERCKFYQVPAEGLNINTAVVRYVPGSHHVLLYRTSHMSIPTTTRDGKPLGVDANGVFDCAEGAPAEFDVTGVVAGAQSSNAKNAATFPPGVAAKIPAGTVLIINTHYLNSSMAPLVAEARLNLYTLADQDVVEEGGFLFFYNPFIRVPARSAATSRMRCTLPHDIKLVSGQSHMHKRGVGYVANIVEPSGAMQPIYESHDWEDVPIGDWSPGMQLHKGQSIDYTCQFQNSEDRQVAQGATTKDEMCMFLGNYYPRYPEIENCGIPTLGQGVTFIGTGNADGKTTLECLNANQGSKETEGDLYGCVQDSCPAVAEQVTAHLVCQISESGPSGACGAVCGGPAANEEACGACMQAKCGPAVQALGAAACN
jgi:hypothetical protein